MRDEFEEDKDFQYFKFKVKNYISTSRGNKKIPKIYFRAIIIVIFIKITRIKITCEGIFCIY